MDKSTIKHILAFIGFLAVVAGIAYVVYTYFFEGKKDKFLDDVDDAFEDDDPFDDIIIDD